MPVKNLLITVAKKPECFSSNLCALKTSHSLVFLLFLFFVCTLSVLLCPDCRGCLLSSLYNTHGGIWTRNPSKRLAADLRLRPLDHWDRTRTTAMIRQRVTSCATTLAHSVPRFLDLVTVSRSRERKWGCLCVETRFDSVMAQAVSVREMVARDQVRTGRGKVAGRSTSFCCY